jgi:putative transposase
LAAGRCAGDRRRCELDERVRADAARLWRVIRPHAEDAVRLSRRRATHGVPLRSAQRWLACYREGGLVALARGGRSDRRRRRLPSELVMLIEGLALSLPRPTIDATHRQASEVAAQGAGPVPSYGSVHAIATALDPGIVALAHERAKPLRQPGSEVSRSPPGDPSW